MDDLGIDAISSVSGTGVFSRLAIALNDPPQGSVEGWGTTMAAALSKQSSGDPSSPISNKADDDNLVWEADERARRCSPSP